MRGRRPKPTELKLLQGTARKDRTKENRPEPTKVDALPDPPDYLKKHGKRLWKQQLQQLIQLKMLTQVDLNVLGQYCKEWDLYNMAIDDLDKNGFKNKYDQISASVTIKNQAFKNMLSISDRFGFVASAREKLSVPQDKPADPLEQHMQKMRSMQRDDLKKWIETTGLNGRIYKALRSHGLKSVHDLTLLQQSGKLKEVKGIGPKFIKQLTEALK